MPDQLIRGELPQLNLRVFIADSTQVCREICDAHSTTGLARDTLAQAITSGLLVSPLLSEDERYTLRWLFDGELRTIMVDVAHQASIRARPDCAQLSTESRDIAFGHGGKVGLVKSNEHRRLSSGMTLADRLDPALDLATYFDISDQIPTICGTKLSEHKHVGVMLQGLPNSDREQMEKLEEHLAPQLNALLDVNLSDALALNHWLNEWIKLSELEPSSESVTFKIHARETPTTFCTCGKDKVEHALMALPITELQDMIQKDGGAQIDCQFCAKSTRFEAMDLQDIIAKKSGPS